MSNYAQRAIDLVHQQRPDLEHDLARLYGLLLLVHGDDVTHEDVHDAWSMWMAAHNPDHGSLVPFNELSREVQTLDGEYVDAIREAHARLLEELDL